MFSVLIKHRFRERLPMRKNARWFLVFLAVIVAVLCAHSSGALAGYQQPKDDPIDILHYKIEAQATPETHTLRAKTSVTFRATKTTQSAIFELNGSLKVSKVTTPEGRELPFVQDTLDALNVRIDLGNALTVGQEATLIFDYEGQLLTAQGGVLPNKRLAYLGPEGSYLTYSSRWFPFHGYATDTATYDISFIVPPELTVVGYSSEPVQPRPYVPPAPPAPVTSTTTDNGSEPELLPDEPTPKKPSAKPRPKPRVPAKPTTPAKPRRSSGQPLPADVLMQPVSYQPSSAAQTPQAAPQTPAITGNPPRTVHNFVSKLAVLPGTFTFGRYIQKPVTNANGFTVEVYAKPGGETRAAKIAEEVSQAIAFYNTKFGNYYYGNKLAIVQIDNESLDSTTGPGITLLSERVFVDSKEVPSELLYRETAYQWWGQAVNLRSFDDAWVSQGLAQYSALLVQENQNSEGGFRDVAREALERALAFESQTSISRAPAELDDQSEAYRSVVLYKGAFVYRMLRLLIGEDKFDETLKAYYEQYKGKLAGINDFEKVAAKTSGRSLRSFFGQWIDSTGVPEFQLEYQIIRLKTGDFRIRGTIQQESDTFDMPVDVEFVFEGSSERTTLNFQGKSMDFNLVGKGKPVDVIVDPDSKLLKISDNIRVSVIVRRGIEHFRSQEYPEAEQQFLAAIRLYRNSSWAWYNLGLLYFTQKNFQKANDTFAEVLDLDLQPRWVEVWSHIHRGNCYDALGQRERAVAEYNKAVQIGDNYDNAQTVVQKYLSAPYRRDQNDSSQNTASTEGGSSSN
jgi:Peptidase family M1 domain/Tetratricopeptide repeat